MNALISISEALVVWLILTFIIRLIAKNFGLIGNQFDRCFQFLNEVKTLSDELSAKYPEGSDTPKSNSEVKKALKDLKKIRAKISNTDSLLEVFLYDNGDNILVVTADKKLDALLVECNHVEKGIHTSEGETVREHLSAVKSGVDVVDSMLKALQKKQNEKD